MQKGPEIRTGLTRNGQDVRYLAFHIRYTIISYICQYPVAAGHEFTVTTDAKYAELCDSEFLFVDYVCQYFDVTLRPY